MADNAEYLEELREALLNFAAGQSPDASVPGGSSMLPRHINIYMFGPQGSGKTSFIRTCFRALYGSSHLEKGLEEVEHSLHRSDDGTSMYSVYPLTDRICLHDTRGQREYTASEMMQLKLVLEGRARPNTLVTQRRRYWLLLREFWRSDDQMKRTFSRTVMLPKATLDTEPHFAFLVLDPNQQELLLEDEDFRQCYSSLLNDFCDRGVPHALLCTHGDTLTPALRSALLKLPKELGCRHPRIEPARGAGGVVKPPPRQGPSGMIVGSMPPSGGVDRSSQMPDVMRIVTNYTDCGRQAVGVGTDTENNLQQDIHTLLVLLDALRQADHHVLQRIAGKRPAPMSSDAETG